MSFPDAGQVEEYSEAEFTELLQAFETDKSKLTKKQMAAVARYNFKKGKGEPIVFRGMAPPPQAASSQTGAGAPPTTTAAGVSVSPEILKLLPPDMQALAAKDPATLSKDEKIALAKAKSQAVKAQSAAPVAAAPAEEGPKGPSPEELARTRALAFPHAAKLDGKFAPTGAIEAWSMQADKPYATVKAERVLDVVRYAKEDLGFDYLRDLTAADHPPSHMEVVYNLFSMTKRQHLALKAKLPREAPAGLDLPTLPSVVAVHAGADWLEREVFDLFGIRFAGHPYMRRLMLPDGWVGHPLRKDYDAKKEQFVGLGADGNDIVSFDPKDGW